MKSTKTLARYARDAKTVMDASSGRGELLSKNMDVPYRGQILVDRDNNRQVLGGSKNINEAPLTILSLIEAFKTEFSHLYINTNSIVAVWTALNDSNAHQIEIGFFNNSFISIFLANLMNKLKWKFSRLSMTYRIGEDPEDLVSLCQSFLFAAKNVSSLDTSVSLLVSPPTSILVTASAVSLVSPGTSTMVAEVTSNFQNDTNPFDAEGYLKLSNAAQNWKNFGKSFKNLKGNTESSLDFALESDWGKVLATSVSLGSLRMKLTVLRHFLDCFKNCCKSDRSLFVTSYPQGIGFLSWFKNGCRHNNTIDSKWNAMVE